MTYKKIFWGIIIALAGITCAFAAFVPVTMPFLHLPLWKTVLSVAIIYWIISNIITGKNLREKLNVFIPLSVLFIVIKNELGTAIGTDFTKVKWWLILIGGILLTIAVEMLCGDGKTINVRAVNTPKSDKNGSDDSDDTSDGEPDGADFDGTYNKSRFSSSTCYIDATKKNHYIKNSFGDMNVYFENNDLAKDGDTITIELHNRFGQLTLNVPKEYIIVNKMSNDLGGIVCSRVKTGVETRTLIIKGTNKFGETKII